MKITILVDQFYKHGGIEKLVALKANYWSRVFKHQVSIISTENGNKKRIYKLEAGIDFKDLNVNFNRKISYFTPKNLLLLIKNIYLIQRHIFKDNPDYIVVASHIPITYILPFLIRTNTKLIKEIHFTQFYRSKAKKNLKTRLFKFVEARYDAMVVLSKEEKTFYNTNNIVVIANPVEKNQYSEINPINKKENIATIITRIAPVKRIEYLIDIWEILIERGIKWKLHIYGDANNSYGKQLDRAILQKGLEEFIFLKDITNEVTKVLNKSKVSLLVSEQECFPMMILESFSVGVPVIAFDCPTGPRNIIINNKNGLLVENNKVMTFAKTVEKFAKNTTLQNALANEAFHSAYLYNIDSVMNEWQTKIFN